MSNGGGALEVEVLAVGIEVEGLEAEIPKVGYTFFSSTEEHLDRRSLSVLESSSCDDGAYPASEPATEVGGVLREPWSPTCSSGVEPSLA